MRTSLGIRPSGRVHAHLFLVVAILLGELVGGSNAAETTTIDFRRDIRPILSDKCFHCHGPAEEDREGGFRLDQEKSAFGEADSGDIPVVPGAPDESALVYRITAEDECERMPPPASGKSLTEEEIELLTRWIEQGAPWSEHWSFVAPRKSAPVVPSESSWAADWIENEIDSYVAARLHDEKLEPTRPADKGALLRRLAFDLTGLPPTPEDLAEFLADDSDNAYEKQVNKFLASPYYGEHRARFWLDYVRYADTHGLHFDNYREMWPYRDWVVNAFNSNMPFSQFVTEQLAGDLLENPTTDQLVATGFNRCHVTTNEGGSIEQEVYTRNVIDRTVTTATVMMGLTFDCTRCHDHKYDPITARDFYSLSAFFNSMDGPSMDKNAKDSQPSIPIFSDDEKAKFDKTHEQLVAVKQRIAKQLEQVEYTEPKSAGKALELSEWLVIEDEAPEGSDLQGAWNYAHRPQPVFSTDVSRVQAAPKFVQHFFRNDDEQSKRGRWTVVEGDVFFGYVLIDAKDATKELMLQFHTNNWEHRAYWGENLIQFGAEGTAGRKRMGDLPQKGVWVRLSVPAKEVGLNPGDIVNGWAFSQHGGKVHWDNAGVLTIANPDSYADSLALWIKAQRLSKGGALPEGIKKALVEQPNEEQQQILQDYFVANVWREARAVFAPLNQEKHQLQKERKKILAATPTSLIYRERAKPRPAHILKRGDYDKLGEAVQRDTPAILPPFPEEASRDRLGLARWFLDSQHPLTARVAVNRIWQEFLGVGLVKTSEDFGSQGEPPSHPALLDYLAVQFVEDGWDVKKLVKRIVMSSTYRQASEASEAIVKRDPDNRLLARGPRFRLDAEMLRDQALFVSGLLDSNMGGPGSKPPQPEGLWRAVGYRGSNTDKFVPDTDPSKVHRRTLYTFFKRTAPPPQMDIFDAPSREACCVRRERTNTPLQALLMLNDPQYLETSQALAARMLAEEHADDAARLTALWRRCTMRAPTEKQVRALTALLNQERERFATEPAVARELLGAKKKSEEHAELAAWSVVSSVVLNADEVLNKN